VRIDVNAFLGHYPFRQVPGGSPSALLEAMDRTGIDQAWISNLAAVFWKDPAQGNGVLYQWAERERRFRPVPAVHPGLPEWDRALDEAVERGVPGVRADPAFYGVDPSGTEMRALAAGCAERALPLLMAVRLEDGRQRHPTDRAPELDPAAIRDLVRSHSAVRLIITHADRDTIEQVHFGSTPDEARRILWDITWIWGPPEDHLALLLETVGVERFTFGTGMPLRIPENSVAKLDLLTISQGDREGIEHANLERFAPSR
jgi:predicted TIM-barrel fold metal-dependent hydrolase